MVAGDSVDVVVDNTKNVKRFILWIRVLRVRGVDRLPLGAGLPDYCSSRYWGVSVPF